MAETNKQRKVLIAYDGSESAEEAFKWYKENLHRETDYVLLVTVVDRREKTASGNPDEEVKSNKLQQRMKTLLSENAVGGELFKIHGEIGKSIIQKAEEHSVSFIVTGSRGLGPIGRTFLGSVSDYVLHHASSPVVIYYHQ